ncbi:MAG TPA: transglutaminase-like domain-containing protein [Stellaceae bacterium]|nr:transglutaminase-like domain-containing protein [Stellaceae bacterium]
MTETPATPFQDRATAEAFLRGLAGRGEVGLPLAEAALALAALDRPRVDLARYHHHLASLGREVGEAAASGAADPVDALNGVIIGRYGYAGDTLTYDDLQNANLMRVIDRRKGLPVALGILYIHAARAQGWDMAGLAFPGHFMVRLEHGGERRIIDPFHEGRVCEATELREILKSTAGQAAELSPAHYADVSDRDVLLRLQNNVKLRLVQTRQMEKALTAIENMLLFAPEEASLWWEAGQINAATGKLRAAIATLERFLALADDTAQRHRAALLLQQLRARLQ